MMLQVAKRIANIRFDYDVSIFIFQSAPGSNSHVPSVFPLLQT